MILLDTNVCVGILRGDRNVLAAYAKNAGNVAMSAMTVFEEDHDCELKDTTGMANEDQ